MSIKSRARALAAKAGVSYQEALRRLRELETLPSQIREQYQWPLLRADAFAVDPHLDDEYREVSRGARYIHTEKCDNCDQGYFQSFDKKGLEVAGSEEFCPACLKEFGHWLCAACNRQVLGTRGDSSVCNRCWGRVLAED